MTALIVKNVHARVLHDGVKETLTELRSRYWIVKGRCFVKMIIHRCVLCRRFEGMSYRAPPPPPLPAFLYTCCVVRAVHLDVVPDMSTQTFIRRLKRFSARRGLLRRIVSDNGKTFKGAAKVIEAVMGHEDVKQYLSGVGVTWQFNIERAPWWGGIFERMVKSTKRCLKKMIGRAKFTYDELLTAITEVEVVINSRPLSYVSPDDLEELLTPSHLFVGRRLLSLPDDFHYGQEEDTYFGPITPTHLGKRMRHLNKTLN